MLALAPIVQVNGNRFYVSAPPFDRHSVFGNVFDKEGSNPVRFDGAVPFVGIGDNSLDEFPFKLGGAEVV